MNPIFRHTDLPLQYLGNLDALCSNFNTTGEEVSQVFSNTVLLVTTTKSRPESFISYCTERYSSVKAMKYVLPLLNYECSHTEVSLTLYCSGNDLQNSVLNFYWFPPYQHATPGLAAAVTSGWSVLWGAKHALCPTKETVRGVILPQENQGKQKCFLDDLGALMLSCYRKAQQCTCAWMEVGLLVPGVTLWSDQDMTIPWPTFCNSWFTDIFALLKFPWHERKKL